MKEGFTLSEVVSTVVAHDSGSAAPASVRLERLEDDVDEGHVSFVVTAHAVVADGDQQILQRTVRVSTPIPSRPKWRVKPIRRYSPSGSAMSRQTLTEISEAKLDEETSMVSADVSARTPDETFDTPKSESSVDLQSGDEATESGGNGSEEDEVSAMMTDSSSDDTSSVSLHEQIAASPNGLGLELKSPDDSLRLRYLPDQPKVVVAVVDCDLSALGDNPLLRQMEADAGDRVQLAVPKTF